MRLSVIIPVRDEIGTIAEVLKRVRATGIATEIVVADDGSTDGTREFLRTQPDIALVENPRRLGKGAAIRAALGRATGDIILLGTRSEELEPAFKDLTDAGFDLGGSGSAMRTPSACVGPAPP